MAEVDERVSPRTEATAGNRMAGWLGELIWTAVDYPEVREALQKAGNDHIAAIEAEAVALALCLWPYEGRGETTYCGLYAGHPTHGVQYGHHFVTASVLPRVARTRRVPSDG